MIVSAIFRLLSPIANRMPISLILLNVSKVIKENSINSDAVRDRLK